MKRVTVRAAIAVTLLLVASCKRDDMYSQAKALNWDSNKFFANHSTMRPMLPGTVSPDDANQPVEEPATIGLALLARGHQRFNIFCAPCHGRAGDGSGIVVLRGFPRPPSFYRPDLRAAKAGRLYDVITHGHGSMYGYADRVSPADRWAIIAYIRALQRSQDIKPDELAPLDLAALGSTQ